MTSNPTVSVAITTYNHEDFIAEAVESALTQHVNFDIEVVVGEDCSTDQTREILLELQKKHPARVRLLLHEHNIGGGKNFVATFHACRGKYVALLDGDDYWTSPTKLQRQIEFLEKHPGYAICGHQLCAVDAKGDVLPSQGTARRRVKQHFTLQDLIVGNSLRASSVVFRRGLFDQFPHWFFGEIIGDWSLHILNAHHGDVFVIDEVLGAYRRHENSITLSQTEKILQWSLATRRALDDWLRPDLRKFNQRGFAISHFRMAKYYMDANRSQLAREYFRKGLNHLSMQSGVPIYPLVASALRVYAPRTSRILRNSVYGSP